MRGNMEVILFLWFAGALCRLSIHAAEYLCFLRMMRRCPGYYKHDIKAAISRINRECGKSGKFKVLLVPGIQAPAILGLWKPKILMPITDYTETEVYYILKHEMLHYYHHDMMVKFLCEILCTVFWWNPAVFWLRKWIVRELEIRVDCSLTSGFSKEEKIGYLECIVKSMKAGKQDRTGLLTLSAFAAQKEDTMKQRFRCIWENHPQGNGQKRRNLMGGTFMRKSIALKSLLRSPVKTLLTFFLIASASFALFSRVTDYAVTTREAENAKSRYHAVAWLDNVVPDLNFVTKTVRAGNGGISGYGVDYEMEDKPWLTEEQLQEFVSLPGVTVAETRYRTAGLVEDYKCVLRGNGSFLFEGTYNGYLDETTSDRVMEDHVALKFDDVKVIAGEDNLENREGGLPDGSSIVTENVPLGEMYYARSCFTRAFFDDLEIGSRCLVYAVCSMPGNLESGIYFDFETGEDALRVIDGLPDNYLETEEFARQKGWTEVFDFQNHEFSLRYVSDMRAIPEFNDQRLEIIEGRYLSPEDTNACVVGKGFLKEFGLSVGDSIHVQLGDNLGNGAVFEKEEIPEFPKSADLTIVGVFHGSNADASNAYSPDRIYVPSAILPVEVPKDYEPIPVDCSVFVENADDIEAFYGAVVNFAQKLDLELNFSDRGWLDVKESLGMGGLASLLTTVLYIVGAVLALFLAVYLYIGRNKKNYAIMRMLGVPGRETGNSVLLPFVAVAALAVPIGGGVGLYYAQHQAAQTLAKMADSVSLGYTPDATLPVSVIVLCLVLEIIFVSCSTYFFLRRMKKLPPLELLQEGASRAKTMTKAEPVVVGDTVVPVKLDMAKLSVVKDSLPRGNYGAIRQVSSYIWRHMRRAVGKTAVSLVLAAVLAAGIGTLALAKITYQDAYYELGVKGTASDFTFLSAKELADSSLTKDFYCYGNFGVHIEGTHECTPMTATSDLVRNMGDDCVVEYGEGYDLSSFDGTAQFCLVGEELAKKLSISPGDEIGLLSDLLFALLEDDPEAEVTYKTYRVIGVAKSEDANIKNGIFTGIQSDLTTLFSMDFSMDHCEFTLADNDRLEELYDLMDKLKGRSADYAVEISYHIDAGGLSNIERIRGLLESLFPIAVAAAVLIGVFGPLLIILQSAQEAAYMRILGVTKKRARCMLVFEQLALCVAGIILVAAGMLWYSPDLFGRSAETLSSCFALYFLGSVCGAAAASVQVTRHKVLELLQVKE